MAGMEGQRPTRKEAAFQAGSLGGGSDGERSECGLVTPYDWQEDLNYFLRTVGDAPEGKAYPDQALFAITNTLARATRAGDKRARDRLEGLEDLYVAAAFPFLSESEKQGYTRMYYAVGGYLTPTAPENEHKRVLPVPAEDYPYLTRLLDKANIPALYRLSGRGEAPLRDSLKFGHVVAVLPRNTEMRRIAADIGLAGTKQ